MNLSLKNKEGKYKLCVIFCKIKKIFLFHENFHSKTAWYRKLNHSSEQIDALINSEGLTL